MSTSLCTSASLLGSLARKTLRNSLFPSSSVDLFWLVCRELVWRLDDDMLMGLVYEFAGEYLTVVDSFWTGLNIDFYIVSLNTKESSSD